MSGPKENNYQLSLQGNLSQGIEIPLRTGSCCCHHKGRYLFSQSGGQDIYTTVTVIISLIALLHGLRCCQREWWLEGV